MMASELIALLQRAVDSCGDCEVEVTNGTSTMDFDDTDPVSVDDEGTTIYITAY